MINQAKQNLIEDWTNGSKLSLTDKELDILLDYYTNVHEALLFHPSAYSLVFIDCLRHLNQLRGFKLARSE